MWNRILWGMVGFGVAAFVMGGSTLAWFRSSAQAPAQTLQAGTLTITESLSSSWSAGYGNMAPGQSTSATLAVTNSGTLGLKYQVNATVANADPAKDNAYLMDQLQVTITQVGSPTPAFSGKLKDFAASGSLTGALAPAASHQYTVVVTMPSDVNNQAAGRSITVTFIAKATQPLNSGWNSDGTP